MTKLLRCCDFFVSINRRHSLTVVAVGFGVLLILFESLLFAGSSVRSRLFLILDVPIRLAFFAILIYGISGLAAKSWWPAKDDFNLFKKREFGQLLSKDPRVAQPWRQSVLVMHCAAETLFLVVAGFFVCSIVVGVFQLSSLSGN